MPKIRPGWAPKQSVYLRLATIELLRVLIAGNDGDAYLNMFFEEWLMIYGHPTVEEGSEFDVVMATYKARVITTIKWHTFGGGKKLKSSMRSRIHCIKNWLKRDLYHLWDLPEYSRRSGTGAIPASDGEPGLEGRLRNMKL